MVVIGNRITPKDGYLEKLKIIITTERCAFTEYTEKSWRFSKAFEQLLLSVFSVVNSFGL
jgi:hypothetical protein